MATLLPMDCGGVGKLDGMPGTAIANQLLSARVCLKKNSTLKVVKWNDRKRMSP